MRKIKYIVMSAILFCSCFLTSNALEIDQLTLHYVYVYSFDKDEVLYEKNANDKMYPASMTKIMTTLVALDNIDNLEEKITLESRVFQGLTEAEASVAGYNPNDEASLLDLLYGIMLPSGADAARAIAFHIAGSEEAYVQLMNDKAKKLGLNDTHFVNTSGLYDDEHFSTVKDISVILKEALKNETFAKLFNAESYRSSPTNGYPDGILFQATRTAAIQNAGLEPGLIEGSKTGFTLEGGLCMASTARINGAFYMVVTGQAGSDVSGAQHLVDAYAIYHTLFNNYENKVLYQKDKSITTVDVRFG